MLNNYSFFIDRKVLFIIQSSLDHFLSIVYNLMRIKEGMNLIWLTNQVKVFLF